MNPETDPHLIDHTTPQHEARPSADIGQPEPAPSHDPADLAETDHYVDLLSERRALEAEAEQLRQEGLALDVPLQQMQAFQNYRYDQIVQLVPDTAHPDLSRLIQICARVLELDRRYKAVVTEMQAMIQKYG